MRRYSLNLIAVIIATGFAIFPRAVPAQDPAADVDLESRLAELLPGMGAADMNARRAAQSAWQDLCFQLGAPGNGLRLAEACRLMAAKIGPETPLEARIWLLKQLERHAGPESVPAIAAQLGDPEPRVQDAARRALANNPSAAAGQALVKALTKAKDPEQQIALIHAVGYRADPASTPALAELLSAKQPPVAIAAARSLAKIGDAAAAAQLSKSLDQTSGEVKLQIGAALVRCSDALARSGDVDAARRILVVLFQRGAPLNRMALPGLLARLEDPGKALLLALQSDDELLRATALQCVQSLKSKDIANLATALPQLSKQTQARLLVVLGARRDRAALPAVLRALETGEPVVKLAAIKALGGVGDAAAVDRLIALAQASGEIGDAARRALEATFIEGTDQKLVDLLRRTEDAPQRAALVDILNRRRTAVAVPTLLELFGSEDTELSAKALAALGHLAMAGDVPRIIKIALVGGKPDLPDPVQRAITEICLRIPDPANQAAPVLEVYASGNQEVRVALLPVLGRIGGEQSLAAIRAALRSDDPEWLEAGIAALTNWPTAEVATDLADLAERVTDPGQKIRIVRGLARVAVLEQYFSDAEELALLKRAMKQATRDEDRRLILDRAREARSIDTAVFAAEFLDAEKQVAEQACRTIVDLLHRAEIRGPNGKLSDKLLQQVIATTANQGLAEDAKKYLSNP